MSIFVVICRIKLIKIKHGLVLGLIPIITILSIKTETSQKLNCLFPIYINTLYNYIEERNNVNCLLKFDIILTMDA
jgi:hypothetical protein